MLEAPELEASGDVADWLPSTLDLFCAAFVGDNAVFDRILWFFSQSSWVIILKLRRLPNSKFAALSAGLRGDVSTFAVVFEEMLDGDTSFGCLDA